jgi:hypothetical protein
MSFATSCHVMIRGGDMADIDLHVELDVTAMQYTPGHHVGNEPADMILKVCLNRPAIWAQNGSESNPECRCLFLIQ